jgi:SAM-dependent methyltransferase/uncharacterized protein YbaR (Trm112 family)
MKHDLLQILHCPRCHAALDVNVLQETEVEIRLGTLKCRGPVRHEYQIKEGIIHFASGFDHEAVKKEIEYENSTYVGSDRLRDRKIIARFPDTLTELWPHTCHFGPDFRVLIDELNIEPGSWVLDIGTGPCWSSRMLAQTGANVIALDVNEADYYGLKTSDIHFEAHAVFFERILESMTNLPFQDGTIDYITFNASFHHTPDLEATLSECTRVLSPGGKIAMVNEEFASVRHKIVPTERLVSDTGSHHTIHYREFERAIQKHRLKPTYKVADHVRLKLERKFTQPFGRALVAGMENFPFAIKQLNSALITLQKEDRRSGVRPTHDLASAAHSA